jgi:hypothetical protein
MDEGDIDPSTNKDTGPKLRTFRGWKRDTTHLDKSRLTKGLMRSHVSLSYFYFFLFNFMVFYRYQVNQL